MTIEIVTQIIQLIVAPTVMVTACTLIQGGALGRYANIGSRIRTLTRERAEAFRNNIAFFGRCFTLHGNPKLR